MTLIATYSFHHQERPNNEDTSTDYKKVWVKVAAKVSPVSVSVLLIVSAESIDIDIGDNICEYPLQAWYKLKFLRFISAVLLPLPVLSRLSSHSIQD